MKARVNRRGLIGRRRPVSGSLVLKVISPSWRSFVHRVTILDLLLMSFAARMRNSKTGSTGLFLRV
nr:MAG TPA: hypothetical protein [Caudoviricetes sp.]DAU50425.1 MAG TPA: hypothetical protein [Caudoviricetes sp.]